MYFKGGIVMREIIIEDYNPQWKIEFEELKKVFADHLKDLIIDIEHVGSTSIEGLCAKPILDIDIVINTYDTLPEIINRLKDLGYFYEGDMGIEGREAFGREKDNVPYSKNKSLWMEHHLYVCPQDSRELKRHIAFRDYLRQNPEKAKEYADIKINLAKIFRNDRESYWRMKTDFIEGILNKIS